MIDCHCHLADDDFDADIDEVVSRAKEANVKAVIVCAEFSSQFQKILDLSKKYPGFCKPALGIHPVQVSQCFIPFVYMITVNIKFVENEYFCFLG